MDSNRVVFQRKDHGMSLHLAMVHHRIDEKAIHAIWVESYRHWEIELRDNR